MATAAAVNLVAPSGATLYAGRFAPGTLMGAAALEGLAAGGAMQSNVGQLSGGALLGDVGVGGAVVGVAVPAWRQARTPLTWYAMPGPLIGSVDPANDPAINANHPGAAPWNVFGGLGAIVQYSGAVWDEARGHLTILGGGHDACDINCGFRRDLTEDTPSWSRRGYPTGSIQRPGAVRTRNGSGWGSDGRPLSAHTYRAMAPLPNGRVFMAHTGYCYDSAGWPAPVEFDPATGEYDMATGVYSIPSAILTVPAACCYDSLRDRVWAVDFAILASFDAATKTGTQHINFLYDANFGNVNSAFEYLPEHDLLIKISDAANAGNSGGPVCIITPSTPTVTPVAAPGATTLWTGVQAQCYDTTRKRFYRWTGGAAASLDYLQVPATLPKLNEWTYGSVAVSTAVVTPSDLLASSGTYGRFWYSARFDAVFAWNGTDQPIYFLPLS